MPFFLISILGGAAISYALIESGYVWEAFWLLLIWIVLLWVAPVLSMWFLVAVLGIGLIMLAIAFWEVVAGLMLAVVLSILIIAGLIHAAKADDYMEVPCQAVEECE